VVAGSAVLPIEVDPRLVEESVLLGVEALAAGDRREFRARRDPLYGVKDAAERDARFNDLHARWFARLRLAAPIVEALSEHTALRAATPLISRCVVTAASSASEEGADLHEDRRQAGGARPLPALLIRLRARTLVDGSRARQLLRRELLFVADMLDPSFGYSFAEPEDSSPGPLQALVRERYRLLWSITVDGRLARLGRLAPGEEEARRTDILRALPMLKESEAQDLFGRLFAGPRPRHSDLWSISGDPSNALPLDPARDRGEGGRCPLCGFPATKLLRDPAEIPESVRARVTGDFPEWHPSRGICPQCAGIYASRGLRGWAESALRTA
jgi:hypothetical protein